MQLLLTTIANLSGSSQEERVELTVVLPNITKLLHDLVCQESPATASTFMSSRIPPTKAPEPRNVHSAEYP